MATSVSVQLRIVSASLSVDEISAALGIEPSESRVEHGRVAEGEAVWILEPDYDENEPLEKVVEELLKGVEARADRFDAIRKNCDFLIWCGVFASGPEATIRLSADLMQRCSSIGADLVCSTYQVEDDEA